MNSIALENSEAKFVVPLPEALNVDIVKAVFSFHNRIQLLLMKVSSSKILKFRNFV